MVTVKVTLNGKDDLENYFLLNLSFRLTKKNTASYIYLKAPKMNRTSIIILTVLCSTVEL